MSMRTKKTSQPGQSTDQNPSERPSTASTRKPGPTSKKTGPAGKENSTKNSQKGAKGGPANDHQNPSEVQEAKPKKILTGKASKMKPDANALKKDNPAEIPEPSGESIDDVGDGISPKSKQDIGRSKQELGPRSKQDISGDRISNNKTPISQSQGRQPVTGGGDDAPVDTIDTEEDKNENELKEASIDHDVSLQKDMPPEGFEVDPNMDPFRRDGDLSPKFAHQLQNRDNYIRSFQKFERDDFKDRSNFSAMAGHHAGEQRRHYKCDQDFYYQLLKELEDTPMDLDHDEDIQVILQRAGRVDKAAYEIVAERFESRVAQGLFLIYMRYSADNEVGKTKMSLNKLFNFMKDFNLFNKDVTKERVQIIFTKRCPSRSIDFSALVDILYKVSKFDAGYDINQLSTARQQLNTQRSEGFKTYLTSKVLLKHQEILEKLKSQSHPKIKIFQGKEFDPEHPALKIFEAHDSLLKHVFTLYESFDIHYSDKSIIFMKDFKKFCFDYCVIPVLCSLNEVIELFKRFQIKGKPCIDFRGFILMIGSIANAGFGKGDMQKRYFNYPQRLLKLFDLLLEMNARVSDELVYKFLMKGKE